MCTSEYRHIGTLWRRWIGVSGLRRYPFEEKIMDGVVQSRVIAKILSLIADDWQVSLLTSINFDQRTLPLPQLCQHVGKGKLPSLVYCMGSHTDVKATEVGAVSGFRFHKCPQEMCGRQMHTLADADLHEFWRSADWRR